MREMRVVAACVRRKDKYLLLRRANYMPRHAGLWGFVAGAIEKGEDVRTAALRELREETGLEGVPVREGKPFFVEDGGIRYHVHPVLLDVPTHSLTLDGEHAKCEWIFPREMWGYKTVPGLEKDFEALGIDVGKPPEQKTLF